MDWEKTLLEVALDALGPGYIFESVRSLSYWVFGVLSPILLVLAIVIRVNSESLSTMASEKGKWPLAIRDFFLYGVGLVSYFGLCHLIFMGFNVLYDIVDANGGLARLTQNMGTLISKASAENPELDFWDWAKMPLVGLVYIIFFFTFSILLFLSVFLRLAHALTFGVVFVWGLVALPMSIVSQFKLIGGWGRMLATVLVWPVIEGFLLFLIAATFTGAAVAISGMGGAGESGINNIITIYFVFAILNLILAATVLAAPFITMALINNSGSITGMVGPFAGAAMTGALAATALLAQRIKSPGQGIKSAGSNIQRGIDGLQGGGNAIKGGAEWVKNQLTPSTGSQSQGYSFANKSPQVGGGESASPSGGSPSSNGSFSYTDGKTAPSTSADNSPSKGYSFLSSGSTVEGVKPSQAQGGTPSGPEGSKSFSYTAGASTPSTPEVGGYDFAKKRPNVTGGHSPSASKSKLTPSKAVSASSAFETADTEGGNGGSNDTAEKPKPKRKLTPEQAKQRRGVILNNMKKSK